MTSTVSNNMTVPKKSKGYSPLLHYWKSNVKANIRMMIILAVLHFAAAPLVLLALIIGAYAGSYDTETFAETFGMFGIVTTAAAGFLGIFIAIGSFNCLHKRSVVDMKLSLPLTSTQRFFSDFLSGLFVYLVPFLAVDIISLLLAWYGLTFMEGKTFHHTIVASNGIVTDSTYICKYFSEVMPALLKLTLCGILAMLMLYTITVLITVCCGSIFEAITYTILVNAVIPGTILLVLYNIYNNLYGIGLQDSLLNPVTVTSVAGGFFYLQQWLSDGSFEYTGLLQPWLWSILFILLTVVYGAAAFFLYRKRRAEQVSKPFVFKLAYYIIITGAMFCIYSVYYINEINMVSMVIVTAVSYMILETVTNRGFRRFWLGIIKYAATMVGAAVIVFAGQHSEGFGAVQRIPSLSSVASVKMYYNGFYGDFSGGSEFTEPENIQTIIDAHTALIKNYNEHKQEYANGNGEYYYGGFYRNTSATSRGVSIIYRLKNGNTIERQYSFLNWEAAEILGKIDLTNEYKTAIAEAYKETILNVSRNIAAELAENSNREYDNYGRECTVYSGAIISPRNTDSKIAPALLYRKGFFEQLADAYYNDIMSINEENYYHSRLKNYYYVYLNSLVGWNSCSLTVPESFSGTVNVLERFGFELYRIEDLSDEEIYKQLVNAMRNGDLNIFDENQWRELKNVPQGEILHSAYGRYLDTLLDDNDRIYLYTIDGNIYDLIRAAMPRNIIGSGCYTIRVFDMTAAIPPELTPLAEAAARERTARDYAAESQYREIANRDLQQG